MKLSNKEINEVVHYLEELAINDVKRILCRFFASIMMTSINEFDVEMFKKAKRMYIEVDEI